MKRVGIAGIGFMGWIHWLAYQQIEDMQVAAICSRDAAKRAGDWTSIQGNFGPRGQQVDLTDVAVYDRFQSMLQDDSLDLIDICLPPGLHEKFSIDAMRAGKHVLCEKPMALTIGQCDAMLEATTDQSQLLVGHVLPFFPEYSFVREIVTSGRYGELQGGEFKRTVSDPTWIDGFFDPAIAGGPLIDLHVHDAHFIRAIFGKPVSLSSSARWRGSSVEYCASLFNFQNQDLVVSSHGGVINQQGRPFTHAFEIRFDKATLQFEFGAFADDNPETMPLKVLTDDGQVLRPDLEGDGDPVDAFVAELKEVERVLNSENATSTILDARLARDAIALCEAQAESGRTGKPVLL